MTGLHVEAQTLDRSLRLLKLYGPNATSEYQAFVDKVKDAFLRVSSTEFIVLMGDFNAHVETDTDTWKGVIEKHGVIKLNENGWYLLQLCCSNGLRIRKTFFRRREVTCLASHLLQNALPMLIIFNDHLEIRLIGIVNCCM